MSDTDGGGSTGSGELAAWLLTEGLPWVTTAEIVRGLLGLLVAHVARLQRWIRKGLLCTPTKGGYVPRATSGGPDWDGIAQVAQQSFVEPVNTVFGFVRVIDGHYLGAEFIGVERPDSSLLSVKRGIGQLVTGLRSRIG